MKALRRVAIWGGVLVGCWLAVCAAGGVMAADGALHAQRQRLTADDERRARALAARFHAGFSEREVAAADGAVLRAWEMRPEAANGKAVLLLHGVGDNRAGMLGNAELLLAHGYEVLLPDARAQGESGGGLVTYGVLEADDVRRWFEMLRGEDGARCIDGLGDSMGAGELLVSLGREPGYCAVVAESPFASFQQASYDRIGQQFGVGPWLGRVALRPVVTVGFLYARVRYGVDLDTASPRKAVAASEVPVLLIHGLADSNLPPRHSELIRAGRADVALWEPPGVEHCGAASAMPEQYDARVLDWFDTHGAARRP